MAYRKFSAPRIFTGTAFVEQQVLVTTQTGRVIELVAAKEAGDDVETVDGMLCPGFVNAHCHTELSHMKGSIPPQTGMVPFLMQVMFQRQANESLKQLAVKNVIAEMYANGIAAVGDICNTADSLAAKSAGRQLYFHNFIETSGFVPAAAPVRFAQAVSTKQSFDLQFPPGQNSITPHAPYSVSEKLMHRILGEAPALLSIHHQESQAEDDFIRHKTGEMLKLYAAIGIDLSFFEATGHSPLQYIAKQLARAQTKLLLVHNCLTTAADIAWLKATGMTEAVSFCLCPNANLYIGNPLPSVSVLQQSGIPICLGTDSLASNDQLSILAEMQTLQRHFPLISLPELLRWATFNGATSLMIDKEFGSFTRGATPGILQISGVSANDSLQQAIVTRMI